MCRLCEEEEETFDHFVNDCPCLWQVRRDHFGLQQIINTHDWKIDTLIKFSELHTINDALEDNCPTGFFEELLMAAAKNMGVLWPNSCCTKK